MTRPGLSKAKSFVSKLSVEGQIVLPLEVHERPRVGPGDRVRFILERGAVRIALPAIIPPFLHSDLRQPGAEGKG